METSNSERIPLQVSRGCVIASIQIEISVDVLKQFRMELLEILEKSRAWGVILDVSGLEILDLEDFNALCKTMEMVMVMGAKPVLSGLKPGLVSALIDLGAEVDGVTAALNLDEAFRLLEQ